MKKVIILLLFPFIASAQQKITISAVGVDAITTDTSHLSTRIDARVKYTDTAAMLSSLWDAVEAASGSVSLKTQAPFIISNDSIYKRYNVLAYGLVGDGVTDNTTALNNLLTTAKAAGGTSEIYFPYTGSSYIISGSLQTADSCQVCIPFTDKANIDIAPHIILIGEGAPNLFTDWGYASTKEPSNGVIIESTSTKQLGSVFGSTGDVANIQGNFTQVTFKNLWIKVRSKSGSTHVAPAMTAIDASGLEMVEIDHCRIETQSPQDSSVTPLNTAYGIKTPAINNWAQVYINDVLIQNFYYGMTVNEHVSADNVTISTCYNGIQFLAGFHVALFKKLNLWWNRTQILLSGTAYFRINTLDFEEYNPPSNPSVLTSRWFNTVNDVLENSGSSRGDMVYQRTVAGVGTNGALINTLSSTIAAAQTSQGAFSALTVTGSGPVLFTTTQVSPYYVYSQNLSTNASARAGFAVYNSASGSNGEFEKLSTAFTTTGILAANDLVLRNATSGHIDIVNQYASGKIQLAAGASTSSHVTINADGTVIFAVVNEYTDNAAAISAGAAVGTLYRTGDNLKIVH